MRICVGHHRRDDGSRLPESVGEDSQYKFASTAKKGGHSKH